MSCHVLTAFEINHRNKQSTTRWHDQKHCLFLCGFCLQRPVPEILQYAHICPNLRAFRVTDFILVWNQIYRYSLYIRLPKVSICIYLSCTTTDLVSFLKQNTLIIIRMMSHNNNILVRLLIASQTVVEEDSDWGKKLPHQFTLKISGMI